MSHLQSEEDEKKSKKEKTVTEGSVRTSDKEGHHNAAFTAEIGATAEETPTPVTNPTPITAFVGTDRFNVGKSDFLGVSMAEC